MLRGSGVKWDIRKAQPYEAYDKVEFDIPIGERGDTYDRYMVRMEEMRQSVRIMRQCVERLAPGPIFGKVGKVIKPPAGEVYHSIEAPKGELGYYVVSDGTVNPYRVRVRPPSLINLQAFDKMARATWWPISWPSLVRWISCWARSTVRERSRRLAVGRSEHLD